MTRALSEDRGRARAILAAEIFQVVKARLEKSGFEVVPIPGPSGHLHKIGLQGQFFANMRCIPSPPRHVALSVWVPEVYNPITGLTSFDMQFRLNCTESPRRVAALIVKFLRKAVVKLVHQA